MKRTGKQPRAIQMIYILETQKNAAKNRHIAETLIIFSFTAIMQCVNRYINEYIFRFI